MAPRMKIIKCYCGNREYHTAACRNTNIRDKQRISIALSRQYKKERGLCNYGRCRKRRLIKVVILEHCAEHVKSNRSRSRKQRDRNKLTKDLLTTSV